MLTLSRRLEAELLPAAVAATLEVSRSLAEDVTGVEIKSANLKTMPLANSKPDAVKLSAPSDYLKFYALQMPDLREMIRNPEPADSLRRQLGANAPEWMVCRERPMLIEERTVDGVDLIVYGSASLAASLRYVPLPVVDGETLEISQAAYFVMLKKLEGAL